MIAPALLQRGRLLQLTRSNYTLWDLAKYAQNNPKWSWPRQQKAAGKPPPTKNESLGALEAGAVVRVEELLFQSDRYQVLQVATADGRQGWLYCSYDGEEAVRPAGLEVEVRAGQVTAVTAQLTSSPLGPVLGEAQAQQQQQQAQQPTQPQGGSTPGMPPADEIEKRRQLARAYGGTDLSDQYPVAEIEKKYGLYGGVVAKTSSGAYRWRCQADTKGYTTVEHDAPVTSVPWRSAAYHVEQASQGDFLAPMGTPISVLAADDGQFWVEEIYAPAKFAVCGIRIAVKLKVGGAWKRISFSHMSPNIPAAAARALKARQPLRCGQAFGFISLTGNHWIGDPGKVDPRTGKGLPQPHTHVWFHLPSMANDPDNHTKLADWTRRALGFSGKYPNGGG